MEKKFITEQIGLKPLQIWIIEVGFVLKGITGVAFVYAISVYNTVNQTLLMPDVYE